MWNNFFHLNFSGFFKRIWYVAITQSIVYNKHALSFLYSLSITHRPMQKSRWNSPHCISAPNIPTPAPCMQSYLLPCAHSKNLVPISYTPNCSSLPQYWTKIISDSYHHLVREKQLIAKFRCLNISQDKIKLNIRRFYSISLTNPNHLMGIVLFKLL